eukprot:EG_transcript_642
MASQFTVLAQESFEGFGAFVNDLLNGNAALVDSILAEQEKSGAERTELTKAQMVHTIGVLVNYTANSTQQTQKQMDDVTNTFSGLMGTVVADFKGLAGKYVAQVRTDLTTTGTTSLSTTEVQSANAKKRLQQLINVGLLDLSRAPTDPVSEADCTLLGVLCDTANDFQNIPFSITSSTGRYYGCSSYIGAVVSVVNVTGDYYTEYRWAWMPYPSSLPSFARRTTKQRCLLEKPMVTITGRNCSLPQSCQCGVDQRCQPWYTAFANATTTSFNTAMYQDTTGNTQLHSSMSLFNVSRTPNSLLAVVDSASSLSQTQYLLPALPLLFKTSLALLLNDTNLTVLGSVARLCAKNETTPGDPSLPYYSAFRSCDPGLRAVAQWLAGNLSLPRTTTLEINNTLWDVSPVRTVATNYFFIVGTNKSEVNGAIDLSEATAASQLATVRGELTQQVAASGATTRAYMAAIGDQNLQATQAMQDAFLVEIQALENSSRVALANSQARSSANAQQMTEAQTTAVETERTTELNTMGITAGWTIAIVFGILLLVLCLSAFGTIRVTNNLTHIIGLMEDVADMKVENLTIPQGSSVQEVARIQTAFEVMVRRLAEYKSYIPAGVFERLAQEGREDGGSVDGHGSDNDSATEPESRKRASQDGRTSNRLSSLSDSHKGAVPVGGRRSATRHVAVLSVNVVGFTDVLRASNEALARTVLNEYVTQVHDAISQGRGNIDFLSGDQIYATFNAHVPCADPAGAASAVALDIRQQLLYKLGDRLKFHIGLSFGPVFASTVGYTKFKFMATFGSPMKVSAVLSHVPHLENGTILVDANLQERMKYQFSFRQMEMLHLPWLKSFAQEVPSSQRVFMLTGKKTLQEDEWLYQVADGTDCDWSKAFEQLVAASSTKEMQGILEQYLASNPTDDVALRLSERLVLWTPGKGIRV